MRDTKPQIHEAQRPSSKIPTEIKSTLRHIILKLQKINEKVLKEDRGKNILCKRNNLKNYIGLLFRNHAKKIVWKEKKSVERKKIPPT